MDLFASGKYRGKRYTVADLDQIVRNFVELGPNARIPLLDPPCVLGHEETQEYLDRSDLPSAGWVTRLWVEKYMGPNKTIEGTLRGTIEGVPTAIASLIRNGRYRKTSAEIYDDFTDDFGNTYGKALRRVAFLGAEVPQVKRVGDIPDPKPAAAFAERLANRPRCLTPDYAWPTSRGTFLCFAESTVMDRAKMIAAITAAMPAINPASLDAMSDDVLADLVKNLPGGAGTAANQSAAAAGGGPVATMGDPATMTREEMIAELTAAGEPAEQLEAMTDDDLRGIYTEMGLGGGAGAVSGGGTATTMDDGLSKEEMIAELTAMGEDATALAAMTDEQLKAKYAELTGGGAGASGATTQTPAVTMSEKQQKFFAYAEQKTRESLSRQLRAESTARRQKIDKFADDLVKSFRILPRQKPAVISHLRKCSDKGSVKFTTFSEGKQKLNYGTELDKTMAEYMSYAPIARFAEEKILSDQADGNSDLATNRERDMRIVRNYANRNAEALKKVGQTPEKFVQTFAETVKKDPSHTAAKLLGAEMELYL
jgi:hypothetical protein